MPRNCITSAGSARTTCSSSARAVVVPPVIARKTSAAAAMPVTILPDRTPDNPRLIPRPLLHEVGGKEPVIGFEHFLRLDKSRIEIHAIAVLELRGIGHWRLCRHLHHFRKGTYQHRVTDRAEVLLQDRDRFFR